ncbi:DNA-directed RNA polymerase subunit [Melia azedarach]|uniref:DNA-directed RNA polymerase subunit n=1 Tax=Melia azedarach TaxID=155640 RepID=A0ACC1XPV8_MELAZ|nr:DNA-directed RNA polymerase subunit [Melia azedarach]
MDNELYEERLEVPFGILNRIIIGISTEAEKEKLQLGTVSEVSDPKLGLPNPTSECSSCGAKDMRSCEGLMQNLDDNYDT